MSDNIVVRIRVGARRIEVDVAEIGPQCVDIADALTKGWEETTEVRFKPGIDPSIATGQQPEVTLQVDLTGGEGGQLEGQLEEIDLSQKVGPR